MSSTCGKVQQNAVQSEGLSTKSFVGPWVASDVEVLIISENKGENSRTLHFDSKKLAEDQGRKPAMTIFAGDGSYREDIYNVNDSLVQSKAGSWHYYEDSLYMRMDIEGSPKMAFGATLAGKGLKLSNKMDWDGDGNSDDKMEVGLRRP